MRRSGKRKSGATNRKPNTRANPFAPVSNNYLEPFRWRDDMAIPFKTVPAPTPPIDPADILTAVQVAERLQVKVSWVYARSAANSRYRPLPVLRCGRYIRFSWPEICQWL